MKLLLSLLKIVVVFTINWITLVGILLIVNFMTLFLFDFSFDFVKTALIVNIFYTLFVIVYIIKTVFKK